MAYKQTKTPKQLLNLSGVDTLINETIDRVNKLSHKDNLFIVTNKSQRELMKETVDDKCHHNNILSEPIAKKLLQPYRIFGSY